MKKELCNSKLEKKQNIKNAVARLKIGHMESKKML